MTVGSTARVASYTMDGVTATVAIPFQFFEIAVYSGGVLVSNTEYTITQAAPGLTGSLTFNPVPTAGTVIMVSGDTTLTQEIDYVENSAFPAESHERGLDRLTMALQELKRDTGESVHWLAYPTRLVEINSIGGFSPKVPGGAVGGYLFMEPSGATSLTPPSTSAPETIASTTQAVKSLMAKVGDYVITSDTVPKAGRIRIGEAPATYNKSDYPELSAYLATLTPAYPWGSTTSTFTLHGGAGRAIRLAASTTTIDPDGPRAPGSLQDDALKEHDHAITGTVAVTVVNGTGLDKSTANTTAQSGGGVATVDANTLTRVNVTATATFTGDAAVTGDDADETRMSNVAFHLDIIASSGAGAASLALFGFPYTWDTGITAADPGAGKVRSNHASLAGTTAIYVSHTDHWGNDLSGIFSELEASTVLRLSKPGAQNNQVVVRLTGAPVAGVGWSTIPCVVMSSNGAFLSGDVLATEPMFSLAGPVGPKGDTGDPGVDGTDGADGSTGATGAGYGGTSTTSLAVGTGTKTFITQAGMAWVVGSGVRVTESSGGSAYMEGYVSAYSGSSLSIQSVTTFGSGTFAAWAFGPPGGVDGAGAVDSVNGQVGAVTILNLPLAPGDLITVNGQLVEVTEVDYLGYPTKGTRILDGGAWAPNIQTMEGVTTGLRSFVRGEASDPTSTLPYVPLAALDNGVLSYVDRRHGVIVDGLPRVRNASQVMDARAGSAVALSEWNGFIGAGQSNISMGYTAVVSSTGFYPDKALTFASGPRADDTAGAFSSSAALFETTATGSQQGSPTSSAGETPCTGIGYRFLESGIAGGDWTLATAPVVFVSTSGVGGSGINNFKATGGFWSRFQNNVTNQQALAVAAGKTFAVQAVAVVVGESDADSDTKSRATFLADANTLYTDHNAYAKAQTGQSHDIVSVALQINYGSRRPNNPGAVALGWYDWANGDTKVLAGPMYWCRWTDAYHPDALHRRLLGELMGHVAHSTIVKHKKWTGLKPRAAWARGDRVYVRFHVPEGPLCLDVDYVPLVTNYGFKVTDSGGAKTITSVAMVSDDTLEIALSADVVSAPSVRYALDYLYPNSTFDPTYGAAGNLRDSQRLPVRHGGKDYLIRNWCLAFDITADLLQPTVS